MDEGLLAVVFLAAGLLSGGAIVCRLYAAELGRAARFLKGRERTSNARMTCASRLPGLVALADAVNAELDAAATERAEAKAAADEFARGLSALSHDVRTPLMGARGYLQLARDEEAAESREAELSAAEKRLSSMGGLLDELFSYARASDPDTPLELEPVAVRPVVETALLGHFPEFDARDWEPVVDLGGDGAAGNDAAGGDAAGGAGPVVLADAEALSRIVENLVVNALRHGAGPLSVKARDGEDGRVSIAFENAVADPAVIDADRLFERFYQADPARAGQGSGLGLAVAAELARAQGMGLSAALEGEALIITLTCPRA